LLEVFWQAMGCALLARLSADRSSPARIAMIAMTTNNSMMVKATLRLGSFGRWFVICPLISLCTKSTYRSVRRGNWDMKFEQKYYDIVGRELMDRQVRPGLWARAVAESKGEGADARYIAL
jgi:hypothetical protein